MKNTIKQILRKADITRRHLDYILCGERNASVSAAKRLERATGIAKELWVFGTKRQRQKAWKKLQGEQ